MRISCAQEHLARGLSIVSRAVVPRSHLTVLTNVPVSASRSMSASQSNVILSASEGMDARDGDGRVRLAATNLETGINCWIPARVEEEGAVAVPARLIVDFVNTLPAEPVEMTLNPQSQMLRVKCGRYNASVKGIAAEESPKPATFSQPVRIALGARTLREKLERVIFAAATDDVRPILAGVLFKLEGKTLTLAAADGFRLSIQHASLDMPVDPPLNLVIPAKALQEVTRLCTDELESVEMTVAENGNRVCFHLANAEVVSQLIDGVYPDLARIIPDSHTSRVVVNCSELRTAVKIMSSFTEKDLLGVRLTADAPAGRLTAAIAHVGRGDGVGEVDTAIEGESFRVSLQVPFLLAVLDRLNSPQVAIEFLQSNSHIAPVVVRPVGDDTFVHVVMPLADDASSRIARNGNASPKQRDDASTEAQPQDPQGQANPEDKATPAY